MFFTSSGGDWHPYSGDVERVLQANIMSGKPNGDFEPRAYTTRAQMVKMLDEFLKYIEFINE